MLSGTGLPAEVGHIGLFDGLSLTASAASEVTVSTRTGLKNAVDNAQNGTTIKLTADITDTTALNNSTNSVIRVDSGKDITIDLGGHTMNRNRTSVVSDGEVLLVSGGTLTVKNGTLKGGGGQSGGGIFNDGTLTMTGGEISSCSSGDAGGVYNNGSYHITLNDVTIQNNTSVDHGGGGIVNYGELSLTDCTVRNNKAITNGGGIWTNSSASVTIANTAISNNGFSGGT